MKNLENLQELIDDAISKYSTKELTGGMNGYPEPYRGTLLIANEAKDVEALERLEREINILLEKALKEAEEAGDDELYDELNDVEVSFSEARWRDGWSYANCYDIWNIKSKPRDEVYTCNFIEDAKSLFYARYIDRVVDMFPNSEEISKGLEAIAEAKDADIIDIYDSEEAAKINFEGCVVEVIIDDEHDYPESEHEWFQTLEEAEAYMNEELVEVPSNYDNRNFAVGLRIFGFTADLYDKLQAGGGITGEAGEAIATGLNVPKYK